MYFVFMNLPLVLWISIVLHYLAYEVIYIQENKRADLKVRESLLIIMAILMTWMATWQAKTMFNHQKISSEDSLKARVQDVVYRVEVNIFIAIFLSSMIFIALCHLNASTSFLLYEFDIAHSKVFCDLHTTDFLELRFIEM